jgi:hypothetical protein
MLLSARDIAATPRWSADRTRALEGTCRGDALGEWGINLTRRFGDDALVRVRSRLDPIAAAVPARTGPKDRFPVFAQIDITEGIIDECLGGDPLELYSLAAEDTRRGVNRVSLALLRRLGPPRVFKLAPRLHGRVYDVGRLDADVDKNSARLHFSGATLFEHPTWRLLQLYANATLLELAGVEGAEVSGEERGAQSFGVIVRW